MRQSRAPMINVINHPKVQAIINNHDLLKVIEATVTPELKDLRGYLETGKSAKYDQEKILGRWDFDVNSAIAIVRRAKPNLPSSEMQKVKKYMMVAFAKTSLVAATDHQAILKNLPAPRAGVGAASEAQTLQGHWKSLEGADNKYE